MPQPTNTELDDWRAAAEDALLARRDTVTKVRDALWSRMEAIEDPDDGEVTADELDAITEQDIREVMHVLDQERLQDDLPTFDQVVGAYQHIESLRNYEDREQREWTQGHYHSLFPTYEWNWSVPQSVMWDEIVFLADAVIECGPYTATHPPPP